MISNTSLAVQRPLRATLPVIMTVSMAISACEEGPPPSVKKKLVQDFGYAASTAEALTKTLGPKFSWQDVGDHMTPCIHSNGVAVAHQAEHTRWTSEKSADHSLDYEGARETAHAWLTEQGFEFPFEILSTSQDTSRTPIWASKNEGKEDMVVVTVVARSGRLGIGVTTLCRRWLG